MPDQLREDLAARLGARRGEIEQTMLTRVHAVADSVEVEDPVYAAGLRSAVSAALGYAIAGIQEGTHEPGPLPGELFVQVRHAADREVSLDTVLRRYFAGYTLLGDFVMQEAEGSDLFEMEDLQALAKAQAMLFDRLVDAISEEYRRRSEFRAPSFDGRRAECARRLLAGELADSSVLAYELDAWHLGVIAVGNRAEGVLRGLAESLNRRLLAIPGGEGIIWAWLGGEESLASRDFEATSTLAALPADLSMVVGEPAHGLSGWRRTHRQADAALPVALRGSERVVRYADMALVISMLRDEILVDHLRDVYLAPLARGSSDSGATLKKTLRTYFSARRNISSAAAALSVNRQTVANRLRVVEGLLGSPLDTCAHELEAALSLDLLRPCPASCPRGADRAHLSAQLPLAILARA
jgi:hypothetical protein